MNLNFKSKLVLAACLACLACLSWPIWAWGASASSVPVIKWSKKRHQVISQYLKLHRMFRKTLCPAGTEEHFKRLYRKFKGYGYYVPTLPDGKLDRANVEKYLPEIEKKKTWIESLMRKLQGGANFKEMRRGIKEIDRAFLSLLDLKHRYFQALNRGQGSHGLEREQSRVARKKLAKKFEDFLQKVFFLLSYGFPVDHFDMRQRYDRYKAQKNHRGKLMANDIYFLRTILEDGAQDPDHTSSDRFLRANINTLVLNLRTPRDFITENTRYDMVSVLKGIKKQIDKGKEKQLSRLAEWRDRVERNYRFYRDIEDKTTLSGDKWLKGKSRSGEVLKEFNRKKQEDVYRFWANKSELMRALYVLETILYNEAGNVDGRDALERSDIAQVVINRSRIPFYSLLTSEDEMTLNLKKELGPLDSYKWANVLFKKGEFSFTYYFIFSSVRVYCPSMTRSGRFLRRENLKIALKMFRKPNDAFRALRYFSRQSMLGRIDMASIWKGFVPLPERPGKVALRGRYLRSLYKKGRYLYLYNFEDPSGQKFKVVQIKGKSYLLPQGKGKKGGKGRLTFYKYRNPHHFKYFKVSDAL